MHGFARQKQPLDPRIVQAINVIYDQYGDVVSVDLKKKNLLKFGRSAQVQTSLTTLMTLPSGTYNETYVSDNLITHVSSSNNSDTGEMVLEGHTISGGILTFVTQTVTLAGNTKTQLTTPMARCTRMYNNTSSDWAGDVYAYEDVAAASGVPGTASAVHCMIPAGRNQSHKASTSVSGIDYWLVAEANAALLTKASAFAEVAIESRVVGKAFRDLTTIAATDNDHHFDPFVIIRKNSDVRMRALADQAGRDVSGFMNGYLATVVT